MEKKNYFIYEGDETREISFPLGGIGTGCVGLAGNGQLVDIEIFGRPNKGSHASLTHFAVKAETETEVLDARVLMSGYQGSRTGSLGGPGYATFGSGPDHRASFMGFPHFEKSSFEGRFPTAHIRFEDSHFPGEAALTAFNPFIPLDEENSSIPAAFFEIELTNTHSVPLRYTAAFSAKNLYTAGYGRHSLHRGGGATAMHLQSDDYAPNDVRHGDMCIATDDENTTWQQYWYRGEWFDNITTFWREFSAFGPLKNREYAPADSDAAPADAFDTATLAASVRLAPGQSGRLRFVMAWNTPNQRNDWNPWRARPAGSGEDGSSAQNGHMGEWRQYYATRFASSLESARYAVENFGPLYKKTLLFRDTLFGSSLPPAALDAVSANLAVLKSPTCLRLEDGSLYGFEGSNISSGSCEGSCTHVWSYTYAVPFLFPRLERGMRTLEYTHSMRPDGGMAFRLMLPLGRPPWNFRPCVDGQYGTVLRVLREYRISGDKAWLQSIWPQVKRSIEYAWSPQNADGWDPEKRGVLSGRQHHTLDMELFGESAWLSGMYLAALAAGALLADEMGEVATAREYREIFARGKAHLNRELFNGEYFIQKVDLANERLLDAPAGEKAGDGEFHKRYWNAEAGEIKYQLGGGCGIDQVLGQWHADLVFGGEVFEPDKLQSALRAIYKYNFVPDMREHLNPCRVYSMEDEAGLVICNWPDGAQKPAVPVPYASETMNGFEYQAASHMAMRGMLAESEACVRALRSRYNGRWRNPWNEFECGSNYARSMASYALLLAYSGFTYNMPRRTMGFAPLRPKGFRCFWSLEGAWGQVVYGQHQVEIQVLDGSIRLERLEISGMPGAVSTVAVDGRPVAFTARDGAVLLPEAPQVAHGICLCYVE